MRISWAAYGSRVMSRTQLHGIQWGLLISCSLLVNAAAGQRFKYNFQGRLPGDARLQHTVTDATGAKRTYVYNRYADFGPFVATSVFGVALGPGNDAGFNVGEPRVVRPPERAAAFVINATTSKGSHLTLSADLPSYARRWWKRTGQDQIELRMPVGDGTISATLRRVVIKRRAMTAPGGFVFEEITFLSPTAGTLRVDRFTEFVEFDDVGEAVDADGDKRPEILICSDMGGRLPVSAKVYLGTGWTVGADEQSGFDTIKRMRRVARNVDGRVTTGREIELSRVIYLMSTGGNYDACRSQILEFVRRMLGPPVS